MKKVIWMFVLAFYAFVCSAQDETIVPPAKPESIPDSALWVGGHEGGVFVSISSMEDSDNYFGTIYFDANGEVWYRGVLKYTGSAPFDIHDSSSYAGWDGDYLFLANGEKLIAVDENK